MDQAERLRNLVGGNRAVRRARVLAVTSGKGGVGKTSLSVNLALALGRLGKKVIIVDVDIGLANADVLLGIHAPRHLGQVLAGELRMAEALTPAPNGVLLLAGSAGQPATSDLEEAEREFLVGSLRDLRDLADIVLIDTGAGITRNVVQFAVAADEVIVVATPDPSAITDAYAMIKIVSREKGFGTIGLVVNQAAHRLEAGRVSERIRLVSRRFLDLEVENLGHVVTDPSVGMAARRKRPFVIESPNCPASACVRSLAERLLSMHRSRCARVVGDAVANLQES